MIGATGISEARERAGTTLTGTVAFTRPGTGTWVEGAGLPAAATTAVWSGPCSVTLPGPSHRSAVGGADQTIDEWTVLVPVAGTHVIRAGDRGTLTTDTGAPPAVTVAKVDARTTSVLRRVKVVAAADTQAVPR